MTINAQARWTAIITMINGLLIGWLLLPLLLGETYVAHTDAALFSYPFVAFFDSRIGDVGVLWNDLSGAGFPSLFLHGYVFQPLLWILLPLLNGMDALHISMFANAWLGSVLVAFALLRMNYHPVAVLVGSFFFPFTLWGWLFEPTIAFFLPIVGAACVAVSMMDARPVAAALSCGALVALSFLSLQLHYGVLSLAAICLLWIVRRTIVAHPRHIGTRADAVFGATVLAGMCIAAVRVLPLVAYAMLSTRQGEYLDAYVNESSIGAGYLLRYIFAGSRLPLSEGAFANTPFIGIGIVTLALLGMLIGRRRPLIYAGMGMCVLLFSLALPHSPTFRLLQLLPGISQLGDPTRYLLLVQLIICAFATEGVHVLSATSPRRIMKTYALVVLTGSILGALLGLMSMSQSAGGILSETLSSFLSLSNHEMIFVVGGGLVSGFLLLLHRAPMRWRLDAGLAAVAVLCLSQGFVTYRSGPPRHMLSNPIPSIAILSELDATIYPFLTNRGLSDTQSTQDNPELRYLMVQAAGTPNTGLLHGIRNVAMFDHIQPQRLDALLAAVSAEYSHSIAPADGLAPPLQNLQGQLRERWHLLERLGVTHVLTLSPLSESTEIFNMLLFPAVMSTDDEGNPFTLRESVSLYVYEVPLARPHVSAARNTILMRIDSAAALSRLLQENVSAATVIECRSSCPEDAGGNNAELTLVERTPVLTRVHVRASRQQWIVIQRQLLPGWRVHVDREPVQPAIADGVLIAVPVSPGEHEVTASFSLGAMLYDSLSVLLSPDSTPWFS